MTWPQATDFNAAVQNPRLCFGDDDLRQGQVVGDVFGLPRPHSGNFADVYQVQTADGQGWAVKCFTRPVGGLHQRYQAISDHLRQTQRAFMVEFHFLEEGIRVHGQWYPIVKMRWVEGLTLNEFIRQHLDKPGLLERLAQMWVRLGQELRDARMAHGDLQHGNVLLVPGSKNSNLALKLIDYDGMFVPALAETPSGEVGHPNYQHPQRLREGAYDSEVDRFAHLLIYTTLRCLRVGGAELWERHDTLENLLFREEDFRRPSKSRLLRELWQLKDREARDLVGHLLLASQGPLLVVPSLDELLDNKIVRPLTGGEEASINALLGEALAPPRKSRVVVPAQAVPPTPVARVIEIEPAPTAVLLADPPRPTAAETKLEMAPLESTAPAVAQRGAPEMRLETPPPVPALAPPPPAFDFARLLDPVVALLSRPAWLAGLGGTALVSFLLVNVLVWSLARPSATTSPVLHPPRLRPIGDVTLKGGYKHKVRLDVERNDWGGPLTVEVDGLPREIKVPIQTLAADEDTLSLALVAPLNFELSSREVSVSLWEGGRRLDDHHFRLSVRKVPAPILRQPPQVHVKAGTNFTLTADVERNGCPEPLRLELEGLPSGVKQESLPGATGDPPRLQLIAAADAPPQALVPATLLLRVGDVTADAKPLLVTIQEGPLGDPAAARVRLKKSKAPDTLSLKAGEREELLVPINRAEYRGPIQLRLDNLPNGVTASAVTLAPALSFATLAIEAEADAEAGRTVVKLVARAGGRDVDEVTFALHVGRSDAAPRGAAPAAPPEHVLFHTVDHVHLAGTLYPGAKGKRGACVLMLHDLSADSHVRAWQQLAQALQAHGHTVLIFDFRGHGESKHVTAKFWDLPVNRALPAFQQSKWEDGLPDTIEADNFPASYLPWMIHDIAAARMFLDLRHENPSSSVNTSNLMVFGVGFGAALGSLWLASEGIRYDAVGSGANIKLTGLKNRDVLRAVWLGIQTKAKGQDFPVAKWVQWAHRLYPDSMVPMEFIYAAEDVNAYRVAAELTDGGKNGFPKPLPGASLPGMRLLEKDRASWRRIRDYLVKILDEYDCKIWTPRAFETHRSYWGFPTPANSIDFYLAHRPGERILRAVPLRGFGINMKGLPSPKPVVPGKPD